MRFPPLSEPHDVGHDVDGDSFVSGGTSSNEPENFSKLDTFVTCRVNVPTAVLILPMSSCPPS